MATDDTGRQTIDELTDQIAELTEQLRTVTEERDAARHEIARMRAECPEPDAGHSGLAKEPTSPLLVACAFCEGDGVYWVHDFEMQCKRCNGTGFVPKNQAEVSPERH
jgi:DnaJ-class molecular chaperone